MTNPTISQDAKDAVQSAWDAVPTLPPIDFTETEAVALAQAFEGEMVAKLREKARQASGVSRSMAEAKSLRQGDNTERRTDLYMWTKPEDTVEWKAADMAEAHLRTPASGEAGEMVGLLNDYANKCAAQMAADLMRRAADLISRLSATDTEAMRLLLREAVMRGIKQPSARDYVTGDDFRDALRDYDAFISRIDALAKGGA